MSDVRFNQWLHQSGTGGVSQVSGGHVGIGTTNPEIAVHSGNTKVLNVGIVTASTYYGNGANLTGLSGGGTGLDLNDNIKVRLGNSQDLQLYHDGSHSYIDDAGTGNLRLRSGTLEITNAAGSKTSAVFNSGSSQDLYFNNTKRFETLNDGIRVSGHIYANDNQYLKLGTSQDLKIYHDGSNSLVNADGTGNLIIQGANDIILRPADGEVGIDINANGAVDLYYDNSKKFETTSTGFDAGELEFKDTSDTDRMLLIGTTDSTTARWSGTRQGLKISGTNPLVYFNDSSNSKQAYVGGSGGNVYLGASESGRIYLQTSGSGTTTTNRWFVTAAGHLEPASNNTYDVGTTSYRVRNIYTNDLNLSNEGSTNSVDNTWGNYTIQEGENDLFLINNRSGKKYKFNLTEVS